MLKKETVVAIPNFAIIDATCNCGECGENEKVKFMNPKFMIELMQEIYPEGGFDIVEDEEGEEMFSHDSIIHIDEDVKDYFVMDLTGNIVFSRNYSFLFKKILSTNNGLITYYRVEKVVDIMMKHV